MKRHELTLEQKISLINHNDRGNGFLILKLAEKYEIWNSSVSNILTCSVEYQDDYSPNANKGIKRKLKDGSGKHIDEVLFEWFTAQRAKYVPISSPLLQEKAREIVEEMGNLSGEFKASNEWLRRFRNRHAMRFRQILCESTDFITATTGERKHRLPTTANKDNGNDVYNANETALLFKPIPNRSLLLSKENCKRGKHPKERYTILLCSNCSCSDKLKPLVIGKAAQHFHRLQSVIMF